jgi:hypothetical protein
MTEPPKQLQPHPLMPETYSILDEQIGFTRIVVTACPGLYHQWLVMFVRTNRKRKLLDQCAVWLPAGEWDGSRWLPFRSQHVSPDVLTKVQAWLQGRPVPAEELSPKEVEAQEAFTQLRDEILDLSDGLEVNEVLCIIDNHTPEWV